MIANSRQCKVDTHNAFLIRSDTDDRLVKSMGNQMSQPLQCFVENNTEWHTRINFLGCLVEGPYMFIKVKSHILRLCQIWGTERYIWFMRQEGQGPSLVHNWEVFIRSVRSFSYIKIEKRTTAPGPLMARKKEDRAWARMLGPQLVRKWRWGISSGRLGP